MGSSTDSSSRRRIFIISMSTRAMSSAQLFSWATICCWSGISRLYFIWCSRLAQKSMAMVRICTSTLICRFCREKNTGTLTIRCRLR